MAGGEFATSGKCGHSGSFLYGVIMMGNLVISMQKLHKKSMISNDIVTEGEVLFKKGKFTFV